MAKRRFLSKVEIIEAMDLPREDVEVPEWGGWVVVKGMTGTERDAFEASVMTGKGRNRDVNLAMFRAKLAARCLVDETGERLFGEDEIEALGRKSALALQRVVDVALRLNGLTDSDVEELTKNSVNGQSVDSTFG